MTIDIFIYGGSKDFNINQMVTYLKTTNYSYEYFSHEIGAQINISLDIQANKLLIDGKPLDAKAIFMRSDVFAYLETQRQTLRSYADNTSAVIKQYALFNQSINMLNRHFRGGTNKIFNLLKAQEIGFKIPNTRITSQIDEMKSFIKDIPSIQKPISGGEHTTVINTKMLETIQGNFQMPHKIQHQLFQPEIRVYRIGDDFHAFQIEYEGIDYRTQKTNIVRPIETNPDICDKLRILTDFLRLDYSAADFMTDPDGELRFLEINTFPMYARFDQESNFSLSKSIVKFLL